MKRAFTQFSQTPGYGHRIFVPYEHANEAGEILRTYCMWGGSDKDTGLAKGWEFPKTTDDYMLAKKFLEAHGFTVESISGTNHQEVWP